MKLTRGLISFLLVFTLGFGSFLAMPTTSVIAQDASSSLQRGYRTGYSDGYMAGYRDTLEKLGKDPASHSDYSSASRAYSTDFGSLEDYQDGYRQGFEKGYDAGYDKKSFDSAIPETLTRRGITAVIPSAAPAVEVKPTEPVTEAVQEQPTATTPTQTLPTFTGDDSIILIPKDTELILELQEDLSTKSSREGDKFTAKVVSPIEISGAVIEGRINKVQKPGHLKRRSEMSLTFDRIVLTETRWSNFAATLTEVLPVRGDNVKRVDNEGTAVGKSTLKGDTIRLGASTGTGAAIGAITAGPVGAAVGAGIGAAFGVGAAVIDRGKDLNLNVNQQLRVRTSYETKIR
jgi:hypothetical protein